MTKKEIMAVLEEKQLTDIIELIEDAEAGELEELELVESLGLLMDETLNREVIQLLESLGVTIIYVKEEDFEDEDENED
ncbi:hypothetical protein NDK47_10345 [Brevibacillus ruminantium]|uniref:Uncharacterized protein n=1 Tax=Brevibacillus ruminantium TaxID=2950604 RepID=A0ABY4WNC5_9BACL|nr:hypothetical protein [Brevibacillus ruminantium]USG67643.1 hypothetical protein NDK47_10345 [Brevibacillus ruminantium]